MNIVFLFNSDHESLSGYYGPEVMESILSAGVLQKSNRNIRVSVGDILTYGACAGKTYKELRLLCEDVYTPINYNQLIVERLSKTYTEATVYSWLFQNMTIEIADKLNAYLIENDKTYLGAMDVDFSHPIHLRFFRNSLIENYRLQGTKCSIFYMMSNNEDPDQSLKSDFESAGYAVIYEDIGARRTYFDNYDKIEHFKRVEDFRDAFASFEGINTDITDDVIASLEEIHPKLFDIFAAASRTLARAETEEDLAQASLSGRRILEKLADYLYPPSKTKYKDRRVGNAEYKNRLWAYIEMTIEESSSDLSLLTVLGKEVDRLIELFNKGLHANPTKLKVEVSFRDLIYWIQKVIDLSPEKVRKPYLAYEGSLY